MDLFAAMDVFVEAVDRGSFADVARRRGMSAAMVGNHVRFLERRLGTTLLARTTRKQSLTEAGQAYVRRCRRILDDIATADDMIASGLESPSGELRVTTPYSVGTTLLPDVIAACLSAHPKVRIDLVLSDRRVDLIEEGFDVAIRAGELADSSLVSRALAPVQLVVCASPGYLAARGTPATVADLTAHACLGFTPAGGDRTWRFSTDEVGIDGPLRVNSGHALRAVALKDLGIIMQPEALVAADLADGRLVRVLPSEAPISRPLQLLTLPSPFVHPKIRVFADLVIARLGRTGASDNRDGPPIAK